MTLDKDKKILIVGLGLIGGSYAAALSQNGWEVGAIDPDPQAIAFAEKAGFIRHGRTEPEAEYVGKFDIVVFACIPTCCWNGWKSTAHGCVMERWRQM